LAENEIGTEGIGKLLAALRINSQISSLNLKKNDFSAGLSFGLHQFLCENASLNTLVLSHCRIECEALAAFAEGLAKNSGLTHLNLSCNQIGDKGVEFIAAGLSKNKGLKMIDLSANLIKDKGGLALCRAIQENISLTDLILKNNGIKDEGAAKFSEITRWKKNLMKLSLNLNPCNLKYLEVIKTNLKSNFQHNKKMMIPHLYKAVEKLHFRDSAFEELQSKITQKEKERQDLEVKVKTTGGKLDEIKQNEEQKLSELKQEYEKIREVSIKLSHEIEELNFQLNVKNMQKAKFHGEKITGEINEKLEAAQAMVKDLIEKSKIYAEFVAKTEVLNKDSQNKEIVEHFNQNLHNEQVARKSAENNVEMLKKRLEEKRSLIENMKNPKNNGKSLGKDFLASEKLASSKKKSLSPIKPREVLTPKLLTKRVKSQSKRFKRNV
jgi:DNA repair exonuclease SbcCD ATPase subunit